MKEWNFGKYSDLVKSARELPRGTVVVVISAYFYSGLRLRNMLGYACPNVRFVALSAGMLTRGFRFENIILTNPDEEKPMTLDYHIELREWVKREVIPSIEVPDPDLLGRIWQWVRELRTEDGL